MLGNKRYEDVKNLWELFENEYGSVGVETFSHPQIAFQGGKTDNLGQLTRDFQEMASKKKPFGIEVSGVGHFSKEVISLKVKRTSGLIKINKRMHRFVNDPLRRPVSILCARALDTTYYSSDG